MRCVSSVGSIRVSQIVVPARLAALMLGAAIGSSSCAAARVAPKGADEPPPATVDEALARLDRAEGDLARLGFATPAQSQLAAPMQPGYAQPPPPAAGEAAGAPVPLQAPVVDVPKEESGDGSEREANACSIACRALASMARSAEHVCGMTGEGDTRCDAARERVRAAGERVHARCPACSV